MADITPGIIHYCGFSGDVLCGIQYTSDWEEDEDAEVITTNNIFQVTCKECIKANLNSRTMNKEHIKQLAKEFCESEYIDPKNWITKQTSGHHISIEQMLAKFLQSMIEKGEVVTKEEYNSIKSILIINGLLFPETEEQVEEFEKSDFLENSIKRVQSEPTVSSARKEVKTAEEMLRISNVRISANSGMGERICDLMRDYANQFKSSPASTASPVKLVSDEEVKQYFHDNSNCFADAEGNRFPTPAMTILPVLELAKWMREQLTK